MFQDMNLNWVDYTIISIIGVSILVGILRGFVREAMSLVTWIVALALGVMYCETAAEWFTSIPIAGVRMLLAFILLVLGALILGGIISHLIGHLIRSTKFSVTDRIIGTLFGFARGAAIVAVIIMLGSSTFVAQEPIWTTSTLIPEFNPLSLWIKEKLPTDLMQKVLSPNKIQAVEPIPIQTEAAQAGVQEQLPLEAINP